MNLRAKLLGSTAIQLLQHEQMDVKASFTVAFDPWGGWYIDTPFWRREFA